MYKNLLSPLVCFIRQKRGGIMLTFAIVLPMILSFCALVFDGAQLMMKRARLDDSLNEGALIVAAASPLKPNYNQINQLNQLLSKYIYANFINDQILGTNVLVNQLNNPVNNQSLPIFTTRAYLNVSNILPLTNSPSFGSSVLFSEVKGKATKFLDPNNGVDFTFVVNLGGSMNGTGSYYDSSAGARKLTLMQNVIRDTVEATAAIYPSTTFAIIPSKDGVPVKQGKNELGGQQMACSFLFKPKKEYDPNLKMHVGFGDMDLGRWGYIDGSGNFEQNFPAPAPNATTLPYSLEKVTYTIDMANYVFFNNRNLFPDSFDQMVNKGWCVKNSGNIWGIKAPYSCSLSGDPLEIYSADYQKMISEQAEAYRRTWSYFWFTNLHLFNSANQNIDDTLIDMFDANNIFTIPVKTTGVAWPGFTYGCAAVAYDYTQEYSKRTAASAVIDRTMDKSALQELVNWKAQSDNSNVFSGMVRAVPEMLTGTNPRKVMVVITTGRDDYNPKDPIRDTLFKDKKLCDQIRSGVKSRTKAKSVDIYVVSVGRTQNDSKSDPDYTDSNNVHIKETKYWSDYCTDADKVFTNQNYKANMLGDFVDYEETGLIIN